MTTVDRMFRVIVAGGIALSATAPGVLVGCGGSVSSLPSDGGHAGDSFPQEGTAPPVDQDAFPSETASFLDAFPQEGIDASVRETGADTGGGPDVFPQEGPNLEAGIFDTNRPDEGPDSSSGFPDGFPIETAAP